MAQMILKSIQNPDTQYVDSLPNTSRGSSGFGSTGTAAATTKVSDLGCNQPMVIPVTLQLTSGNPTVPGSAMIDSGASTQFLDLDFAVKNNLPLNLKPKPETLIVVDGREATSQLTHSCTMNLTIDQHLETLTFQVTKLAGWDMILGKIWLKKHNPVIDWTRNTVTFSSGHCQANCLPTRPSTSAHTSTNNHRISLISCAAFQYATK